MCDKAKVVHLKRQTEILPAVVVISNSTGMRYIEKKMTLPYRPEKGTSIIFYVVVDGKNVPVTASVRNYSFYVETEKLIIWLNAENEKCMDLLLELGGFETARWHS